MLDPRIQTLAAQIVRYSLDVQPGERVWIDMIGEERELVKCIAEEVFLRGGHPYVFLQDRTVQAVMLRGASEEQFREWADRDYGHMQQMQCYVAIRSGSNASDLSDVPEQQMRLYNRIYQQKVHLEHRVKKMRWVVLRYPNASMAQSAAMSTASFEQFYFNVCNLDYAHMAKAMEPLKLLMERTDKVRITAPGTDLSFSIKNIGAVPCCGRRNLPDGEVYTAPIRDSVEGTIAYNTPSIYSGVLFEQVKFRLERGKIVEASANETQRLNAVLDTDEGARFIGEFSLGFNPYIMHPMKDILFDEKIAGSLHFTPGQAYEKADNGNRSAVHWDLVLIQRPEYGGGEVWFDDRLIRKDGRFVIPELEGLNPEKLIH